MTVLRHLRGRLDMYVVMDMKLSHLNEIELFFQVNLPLERQLEKEVATHRDQLEAAEKDRTFDVLDK